jgi:5-methylcytosine-specific restriction endonuclease McrA
MKTVVRKKTGNGGTTFQHTIFGLPHRKSYANSVLLNRHYYQLDPESPCNSWKIKVKFHIEFLKKRKKERGSLICVYCGKSGLQIQGINQTVPIKIMATVDHFIPSSKGGDSGHSNMVVSCSRCNNKKKDDYWPLSKVQHMDEERFKSFSDHHGNEK